MKWYGEAEMKSLGDCPDYLRREYILSGYRVGGGYLTALRSLFELHNETMNAWTTVWISAASSACLYMLWKAEGEIPLPFWWIWLSVVLHLPFSVGLHLFIGISENVRKVWRTLDVFFIQFCSLLLAASLGYYVCKEYYVVYLAVTSAQLVSNIYSTMIRRRIWNIPKPELALHVATLVLMYCAPIVVQMGIDLYHRSTRTVPFVVVLAIVLETGRRAYSQHIPEKWIPGKLDHFGNSHQIMHVMALLAHMVEWAFNYHMYKRQFASALTTPM